MSDFLWSLVLRRADAHSQQWLAEVAPRPGVPLSAIALRAAFAGAGRRLRGAQLKLSAEEHRLVSDLGIVAPDDWGLNRLARAALLLRALEIAPPQRHVALVREIYLKGDEQEQVAVLRSLSLLPDPARFLEIGTDGCRTNVRPEPAFNQLVLKAYFVGVPVLRILGLEHRRTPELRRMAADYASERRAAGRTIPPDIDLAMR
jgi:hypothetical protein